MSVRLVAVSFDAHDPRVVGAFWADVLGREVIEERNGVLVPGDHTQVGLRFVAATTETSERNRLHVHVTSSSLEDQQRIVQTALTHGGGRPGSRPLPVGRDIYLTDPAGNEFCVIQPEDDYLAGCGPLGEVTCDGTRAAASFWLDALGWSIVWDEGEQLAIQSPAGGTKIGWDSWPDAPRTGRDRQRFDLTAADPVAAAERLVALGATRLDDRAGAVRLVDPGGDEFSISRVQVS